MTLQVKSAPRLSSLVARSPRQAFTLIELMMVIAIMAVIIGMVVAAGRYGRMKATVSRAKAELEHIANALAKYSLDNGVYPASLITPTPALCVSNRLPENVDCTDPWGRQYVYETGPDTNPSAAGVQAQSYTLYSRGPMGGVTEVVDDIYVGNKP